MLAAVRELTPEQESGLVRTALRSSLEEDDTQLLNDFLSKAQAKRAARMAAQDAEPEVSQPQDLEIGCHTPPRKALDDLDKNSPSPTKGQFSAPKTNESAIPVPVEPASKETRVEESQPPANPVTEQSTETPQPNPPQVRRPAIRNTFLRRAKGMESILRSLSKGEEEFEMETKRNTAHNTGEMLPGHRLLAMDLGLSAESLSLNQYRRTSEKSPEEPDQEKVKKHVSWRRTRFIEYETGESCDYFSDTSSPPRPKRIRKKKRERNANTNSRERPSHAQTSQNDSENETETEVPAPAPAPTLPAASNTRARRARQLCPSS